MTDRQAQYRTRQRDKGLTQVAEWIPKTAVSTFKTVAAALRRGESAVTLAEPADHGEADPLSPAQAAAVTARVKKIEARLKRQMTDMLQTELARQSKPHIDQILAQYKAEYDQYRAFNEAYRGAFTEQEYRLILSALHPDRCLPERAEQCAKAFHLVKSKETILCGAKAREDADGLPGSLAELFARRKG